MRATTMIEIDFTAVCPAALRLVALRKANTLLGKQKLLGTWWWPWVQRSIQTDTERVAILCALSFSPRNLPQSRQAGEHHHPHYGCRPQ